MLGPRFDLSNPTSIECMRTFGALLHLREVLDRIATPGIRAAR
jgi:hypothetical protein